MKKTKIARAQEIVDRFKGRLTSQQIKAKIASQCEMTIAGATTYYYLCGGAKPMGVKTAAAKRR